MAPKTLRICKECGNKKVITAFAPTVKSHGVQQYKKVCIECEETKKANKIAEAQERAKLIAKRAKESANIELTDYKPGFKVCTKCGDEKPISEFFKDRVSNGKQTYRGECKKCSQAASRLRTQKYRALKNELVDTLTEQEWQDAVAHWNGKCAYCWEGPAEAQEHVVPVSQGGSYASDNIIPACNKCNSSKGGRNMVYWYKQQEFFTPYRLKKIQKWLEEHKL